ncbi:protein wings apart-like [Lucilia sericata]|uniref:protein wings apart-like n=1 Tax=Lucilia sericata TaxID=13632 RepID=UPI0018A80DA6|nr:protein wings apart-like [Lucilia sericata]XP_037814611.1 protein wings apart-like [Lucilia sericata]XP_037814613.1 protein wings apart-like [Lucilia sericata]XP_037814614.1 protein wings apart-like [Lucilia sericata]
MSRWSKNILVPLDTTKESANRPTVARSMGTMGKWGKMGFTSTRTYTMSVIPAAVAAAAAAVAANSPQESPASHKDDEHSTSALEPPKPRKFFKSRNTTPPEVIAQIMQQLPRQSTSPTRDTSTTVPSILTTPVREPIKLKIPKSNSAERKKKTAKKKLPKKSVDSCDDEQTETTGEPKPPPEPKSTKKKKPEKELKPEAPPSRVLGRARKAVNYCEVDDDDRTPTPIRDIIVPKDKKVEKLLEGQETPPPTPAHKIDDVYGTCDTPEPQQPLQLPPPAVPQQIPPSIASSQHPVNVNSAASKTPEHPPIVLRISKGTSRLVSTDSEEQQPNASCTPPSQHSEITANDTQSTLPSVSKSRHSSVEETTTPPVLTTPKIIVKPPKPPSPKPTSPSHNEREQEEQEEEEEEEEESEEEEEVEPPEINYCTVKISPDKPPKERLKLIIKTDVIRNALAAAAAAAAAKAKKAKQAASTGNDGLERPEKEKKKSKKHKHLKHAAVEQLAAPPQNLAAEFKTPSPHLSLSQTSTNDPPQVVNATQAPSASVSTATRTVISPPTLSEKDFDSQSSVLGSISSKGNSTPLAGLQPAVEESCVIHSRGSSVITSDLETSQHSSLVAPPSDIELRLESMMMDGESSQQQRASSTFVEAEPLQEDILAVLRGEETTAMEVEEQPDTIKENGIIAPNETIETPTAEPPTVDTHLTPTSTIATGKRVTRGRNKTNYAEPADVDETSTVSLQTPRTRGRKPAAPLQQTPIEEPNVQPQKRTTRRGRGKVEDTTNSANVDAVDQTPNVILEKSSPHKSEEENNPTPAAIVSTTRRGRTTRNNVNNSNVTNLNNNNINKIAANLTAKVNQQEIQKISPTDSTTTPSTQRSYSRKRKNQQVTQVLQPSSQMDELEDNQQPTPAKQPNLDLPSNDNNDTQIIPLQPYSDNRLTPSIDLQENNSVDSSSLQRPESSLDNPSSSSPPPRRDYKIKDKFKRTLTLDTQVNNAVVINKSNTDSSTSNNPTASVAEPVKLVISKKKGSIFKSRVPSEQTDQAGKRHLYKHRWDATANGDANSEGNTPPSNTQNKAPESKTTNATVEAIFNDFNSDETRSSPVPAHKMTRVIKANPQAYPSSSSAFDMDDDTPADTITSIRIDRKAKDYYTVVRNVKTAHQIQEIGEYQEMDDDVEYILDALQPHNPMYTRCLSALQLATKCMVPAFRMHVRAHGVVTKFFKALSDANRDLSLGLCTTAIMYILSQEGLNMDLDRDSLELMMNLLESEQTVAAPADHANYERNKQRVRELCEEIKVQGKATHLNVDSITVGTLAMETLLSLTSKRAGDWFKEELRELGGLEHIIKTINDCCRPVIDNVYSATGINWTRPLLDNMQTVERCLRVLENVTQLNEENQRYILTYNNGSVANTLCSLYSLCDRELILYPTSEFTSRDNPGIVIRELLIPLMKVLISLTHPFSASQALGAELVGQKADVIDTSFHLLLKAPNYIPDRCVFELSILSLLLLINLTMYTIQNRARIMKAYAPTDFNLNHHDSSQPRESAISAVMAYFYKCEELARLVEKNTDAFLDNQEKNKKKQEEVDETVNNLLQKAGHHMEHSLKGSYTAILVGHLITDNEQYEAIVRSHLIGNGFKEIISVLEKYYNFMNLTASAEASVVAHKKSTKNLLDYFKKRDLLHEMNADDNALPLNLETTPHHQTNEEEESQAHIASTSSSTSANSTATNQRVYKTYSQR